MIDDQTEAYRAKRVEELNTIGWPREVLEGTYGKVWSTDELRAEFEIRAFLAPLVVVTSRADGSIGSLEFQHSPRFYFNLILDK